jgi:hypothetical protein
LRRRNAAPRAEISFMPFTRLDFAGFCRKSRFLSPIRFSMAALMLGASQAGAEDAGAAREGVARAASLMREIREICAPFGANAAEANKYYRAFTEAGAEAFGRAFSATLARETARRRTETQARGPALWCEEQREKQKAIGNGRLFEPGE